MSAINSRAPLLLCLRYLVVSALLHLFAAPAHAGEWLNNFELSASGGYGERSNPLLNAEDIQTYINLDIAWYGERFFFDNGDIGYELLSSEQFSLGLLGELNNERVFFGKTNSQIISIGGDTANVIHDEGEDGQPVASPPDNQEIEVPDRHYAYEAGLEFIYHADWGQTYLSVLTDVSNQHNGHRLNLGYSYNQIWKRWFVQPSVGVSWKSHGLTNYYFGVREDEETELFGSYEADSTMGSYARILVNYAIDKNLFWGLALEYEKLGSEVTMSPIIVENQVTTAYAGIKYRF